MFFNRNLDAQTIILKTLIGLYFGIRILCFKNVLKSPLRNFVLISCLKEYILKVQRTFFRKTVLRKNLFSCEIVFNFSEIFLQICNQCKILYVFYYFDTHMAFFEKIEIPLFSKTLCNFRTRKDEIREIKPEKIKKSNQCFGLRIPIPILNACRICSYHCN